MSDQTKPITHAIREFYDQNVSLEWERLDRHPIEFLLTKRVLDQYIHPAQSVLDLGGGPGRYSLYLCEHGCQVTLMDLSSANVEFALSKASAANLCLEGLTGDALDAPSLLPNRQFDHILLMGPLYHLLEEADRQCAVNNALYLLKPGGRLYVSFLPMFSGMIYYMRNAPEGILNESDRVFSEAVVNDQSYGGAAFTQAYFIRQADILPFMSQFALEDQHILGQEGILAQFENCWIQQSPEVQQGWLDMAYALLERPEFLSYSEHIMVHGLKPKGGSR